MAGLRDEIRELGHSGRAQAPAHAAAELLQSHAAAAMDRGIDHLNRGQPSAAREAQRQAADHAESAARQAADIAEALRLDRPATDAAAAEGAQPTAQPAGIATARAAQQEAGVQLARRNAAPAQAGGRAQAAAAAMQQAARGLRASASPRGDAARQLAQQAGANAQPGRPGASQSSTPTSTPGQAVDPDLGALDPAHLDPTKTPWGELPGHLKSELLEMSKATYREDYARLIQLYFREIASGTAPLTPGTPAPMP
jgi:hypothetical protein